MGCVNGEIKIDCHKFLSLNNALVPFICDPSSRTLLAAGTGRRLPGQPSDAGGTGQYLREGLDGINNGKAVFTMFFSQPGLHFQPQFIARKNQETY